MIRKCVEKKRMQMNQIKKVNGWKEKKLKMKNQ